ncbi:GTP cyclohydrolase I [Helicobacter suis]|uniref:GTP cyclohydrolase I FolE n=1 Tax=Helicobacter suis TaxID=104628 RepID=UPI001596616B|nr:GTP cyclohydrolase I FolE [Helicobacter suis]BCD47214.1 GTP cyclohydrolase I [Helicobacter suis]
MTQDLWNLLCARIGEDPQREGLKNTPQRVKLLWEFLTSGYQSDPEQILQSAFEIGSTDVIVLLQNIEFYSLCEHHLLPFFGHISIGYIPNDKVVGLSALARFVESFARRLQIQERLTTQIAQTLKRVLEPKGVGVICTAKHLCMAMQGIQKQDSVVKTSVLEGIFKENARTRAEFMQMLSGLV